MFWKMFLEFPLVNIGLRVWKVKRLLGFAGKTWVFGLILLEEEDNGT